MLSLVSGPFFYLSSFEPGCSFKTARRCLQGGSTPPLELLAVGDLLVAHVAVGLTSFSPLAGLFCTARCE